MKNRDKIIRLLIVAVFLVGILIKAYYVHYTPVWVRQHDVIGFGAEEGHAAYIEYIFNNRALPDFDPRSRWAFFQPPLHHIISAIALSINFALKINAGKAQENLQILTFLYMVISMIFTALLFVKISRDTQKEGSALKNGIKGLLTYSDEGLLVALLITAVHPIFTLLSGSINNDALSLMLAIIAIYSAICWYRKPGILTIIPVALFIGLSMMAKLTGGLTAVPVGALMIMKFADGLKKWFSSEKKEKFFLQYFVFAIIVFPLGLWWTVRNIVKWNMPVNYIPVVGEQLSENNSPLKRLFDVRINSPYAAVEGKNALYSDYNVPLTLIKTSLFGEWDYSEYSSKLTYISWMLLIVSIILIVLCIAATFYMTFSKNSGITTECRVVLFLTWITYLLAYLSFALSYNNFSAEDFRYGAICVAAEGIYLGLFYNRINKKWLKSLIMITSCLFGILSVAVYFIIGVKS